MKAIKAMQTALLSLAIAGALLGLGGCSLELPEWGNPSGWTPGGPSGGTSGGAGETVTSAEWAAAFDAKNFTNYQVEYTLISRAAGQSQTGIQKVKVRHDGNKHYMEGSNNFSEENNQSYVYIVKNDDGSYDGYRKFSDGEWEIMENEMEVQSYFRMGEILGTSYKPLYEESTYDEEEGCYVYFPPEGVMGATVGIQIKDGKLQTIVQTVSYSSDSGYVTETTTYHFTFGGQKVTPPSDLKLIA